MDITTFLTNYWKDIARENREAFVGYFHSKAVIYLHDSNEKLTPETYMTDDSGYKGDWQVTVDRINRLENDQVVTITFHRSKSWTGFITSFFTLKDDRIIELHEYFSPCDDNIVPQWRDDLAEGEKIK